MNELDIMLIAAVVVSSLMGYFKGLIKEAMGVFGVIVSVVVTYIYFNKGGSVLSLSLIFILTNLGFITAFWALKKFVWQSELKLSSFQRLGGVAIGFVKGMVSVLIVLASLALFAGIIKVTRPDINKYVETSVLYKRYQEINRAFNRAGVKDTAESFKSSPGPGGLPKEVVKEFIKIGSVKAILEDKQLIEDLNQEDYAKVIGNPKFLKLLNDTEFLKQVVALGLRQGGQSAREKSGSGE